MSLTLTSSNKALDACLRRIDNDDATSPVELQAIRDQADERVSAVTGVTASADAPTQLGKAVAELLLQAAALVEGMQRVALDAHSDQHPAQYRHAPGRRLEYQLGSVFKGHD